MFQFCFVIFSVGVPGGALRGCRDGRRPLDGQVAFGLTAVLFEALFALRGLESKYIGCESARVSTVLIEDIQMVTKNDMGREGYSNSGSVWHCGDGGLF